MQSVTEYGSLGSGSGSGDILTEHESQSVPGEQRSKSDVDSALVSPLSVGSRGSAFASVTVCSDELISMAESQPSSLFDVFVFMLGIGIIDGSGLRRYRIFKKNDFRLQEYMWLVNLSGRSHCEPLIHTSST